MKRITSVSNYWNPLTVETIAILSCKQIKNEITYKLYKQMTNSKLWHMAILETI